MAMFFDDSAYIKCPKCGSTIMYCRTVGRYKPDEKDKMVLNFTPVDRHILCGNCNTVVKRLDPLERIRGYNGEA